MTKLGVSPKRSPTAYCQMWAGRLCGTASLPAGAEEAVIVLADDIGGKELEEVKCGDGECDPIQTRICGETQHWPYHREDIRNHFSDGIAPEQSDNQRGQRTQKQRLRHPVDTGIVQHRVDEQRCLAYVK